MHIDIQIDFDIDIDNDNDKVLFSIHLAIDNHTYVDIDYHIDADIDTKHFLNKTLLSSKTLLAFLDFP